MDSPFAHVIRGGRGKNHSGRVRVRQVRLLLFLHVQWRPPGFFAELPGVLRPPAAFYEGRTAAEAQGGDRKAEDTGVLPTTVQQIKLYALALAQNRQG